MKNISVDDMNILNEIGRWKIILMRDLHSVLNKKFNYAHFTRKIKRLEKWGLVKSKFGSQKNKYVTLSAKGSKHAIFPCFFEDSEKGLLHDIISTGALIRLLDFENFVSGSVSEGMESAVSPDGVIHAVRNGEEYILAVEIELSQKSKSRVSHKFIKYAQEKSFDHVLYLTHKKTLFNAYRKVLEKTKEHIRNKIILSLDESLGVGHCDYKNAACWTRGGYFNFIELFGNEGEHTQ